MAYTFNMLIDRIIDRPQFSVNASQLKGLEIRLPKASKWRQGNGGTSYRYAVTLQTLTLIKLKHNLEAGIPITQEQMIAFRDEINLWKVEQLLLGYVITEY